MGELLRIAVEEVFYIAYTFPDFELLRTGASTSAPAPVPARGGGVTVSGTIIDNGLPLVFFLFPMGLFRY